MVKREKGPRQPLIGVAVSAAGGIILAENTPSSAWVIGVLCLVAAAIVWQLRSSGLVLILTVAAFFGLHRIATRGSPGLKLSELLGNQTCTASAQGVVIEEPEIRSSIQGREMRSRFALLLQRITIKGVPQEIPAPVLVDWRGQTPARGDLLEFTAEAHNLAPPRNPGQFNQPAYFNRLGIFSELQLRYPMDGKIVSSGHGNPLFACADSSRHWMQRKLTIDLEDSPEISGLIQSLVLGLKEATPDATRDLFRRTGTMHLFVVNGLHVGLFAAIIWNFLKPFGITRRRAVFVIVPLIAFYALVTGLTPGSIRATLMAAVLLGGHILDRKPVPLNSLAAAAFAVLLFDTNQLFMPGFQFSFGVVMAILLLASSLRRLFARLGQPDLFLPRSLWNKWQVAIAASAKCISGIAAVSLAAWIGSIPFTIGYFHLLSVSAILANLLIVPMAFTILGQGILSMISGSVSSGLGAIFTNANWAVVIFLLGVVQGFAAVPAGHIYLELPHPRAADVEITVFDFGRGNAIHVRADGRDWLFDTGNSTNFKTVLRPYLRSRGINRLEGLILSHGRISAIGGALEAIDEFTPRQIIDSPLKDRSGVRNVIYAGLAQRNLTKRICSRGDTIELSKGTLLRILFPPPGFEARTADSRSLVVQIEGHSRRVLFMFDSGYPTEQWLQENEPDLKCDILIKGMHADEASGTPAFLAATHPQLIICGSGGNPGFSRISEEWAGSVGNAVLFRQDKTGAVTIYIKDHAITARSYLGTRTFP